MNDIILLLGSDGAGGKLYGNKLCKKCIQNLFILGSMLFSWGYRIHPCGCYSGRKFYRQYRTGCGEYCYTGISALFTYGNHPRRRCRRLNWEKLGEADLKGANRVFGSVLSAGLITGVLFAAVSLVFRIALCSLLGATPELLPQALQYLTVVFAFAPIYVLYNILSIAVRTDGAPKLAAISSAGVIVSNLSLDLLFMKVLNWGLVGASASLCIAETVGTLILLTHFWNKQALLSFHFHIPTGNEIKEYVENGFGVGSAFIFQAVVMLVFNTMLLKGNSENGTFSVAVFGVIYTMSTIPGAMFDGAGAAASTVISILGGEKDWKGMLAVYHDGLRIVAAAGVIMALFFAAGAKTY